MSGSTEVQSLYDTPFPALSHDQLAAVIERHHLAVAPDAVKPMRSTGIVHSVYSLGGSLVLRVPKEHPEAIADAYTGSVAAPVAYAAGVRTPALVAFDDDRDIVAVPYSIFERAPGEPLVLSGAYPQDLGELWADLGRYLALCTAASECATTQVAGWTITFVPGSINNWSKTCDTAGSLATKQQVGSLLSCRGSSRPLRAGTCTAGLSTEMLNPPMSSPWVRTTAPSSTGTMPVGPTQSRTCTTCRYERRTWSWPATGRSHQWTETPQPKSACYGTSSRTRS